MCLIFHSIFSFNKKGHFGPLSLTLTHRVKLSVQILVSAVCDEVGHVGPCCCGIALPFYNKKSQQNRKHKKLNRSTAAPSGETMIIKN